MTHDSPTRAAILDVLATRRGVHKSELCRLTGKGWGTIGHHVYVLVRSGRVATEVHGRLLWVFLPETAPAERAWLVATSVPERLRLLEVLGLRRRSTIQGLSSELEVSKKVIRTHLGHLRRVGAVQRVSDSPATYEAPARNEPARSRWP